MIICKNIYPFAFGFADCFVLVENQSCPVIINWAQVLQACSITFKYQILYEFMLLRFLSLCIDVMLCYHIPYRMLCVQVQVIKLY